MTRRRLTNTLVTALEPRASDYVEWCKDLPGFGCRVWPSGKKVFIAQYRAKGQRGAAKRVTVGAFGKFTTDQARKAAADTLANASLGIDEAAASAKRRGTLDMAALCDEYLEKGCRHKKPSTLATDKGRIERHIKPLLGRKLITEITRGDINRFKNDVASGKTKVDVKTIKYGRAIVTGGEGTATRTLRLLGGIFTYAFDQGYIESNPRAGVKGFEENKCERFLSNDELERLGETLRLAETEGLPWNFNEGVEAKHRPVNFENQREVLSEYAVAAIRLLLLTGCRAGEILKLQWKFIDFERGFLNLPTSKTGAKVVILGAPALQVLADIPRVEDNPFVIVGDKEGQPRSDIKRPWKRIIAHAGLSDLRLHDLRHSYASVGAASGMGLGIVGKLLGHASPSTTARYSHFADDPLRRASESISTQISAALDGKRSTAKIIKFKAG